VALKGGAEEVYSKTIPIEREEEELKLRFSKGGTGITPLLQAGDNLTFTIDRTDPKHIEVSFSGSAHTQEYYDYLKSGNDLSKIYHHFREEYLDAKMAGNADTTKLLASRDSVDKLRSGNSRNRGLNTQSAAVLQQALIGMEYGEFSYTPAEMDMFLERFKNDPYTIKAIRWQIDHLKIQGKAFVFNKNNGVDINSYLSEFKLPGLDGKQIKLSDFKGKYVLVDFWASWCAPCRVESPYLLEAVQRFGGANFSILSVSIDVNSQFWKKAIDEDHTQNFVHVQDSKGWKSDLVKQFKITGIPTNFLVAPDGKVIAEDMRGKEMIVELNNILKVKTRTDKKGK
jgi:thiol-disulfide isomerase/thioredoxin